MAISVLIEALLPGGEGGGGGGEGGKPPPKDEAGRTGQKQTESLVISAREIRSKSSRDSAWHHWGDKKLDPQ